MSLITAAKILRNGGLVAFPTETVYGLGADAQNPIAIRKIFKVKKRPYHHPLIVHIADPREIDYWAKDVPQITNKLIETFWPGPLTLVLKKQDHVLDLVTGGQKTVALRMPDHPLALELLSLFGGGVVAPSANQFTHISPTEALAVYEELGRMVDYVVDGGPCTLGLESTIIDMSGGVPNILRFGMVCAEDIESILQIKLFAKKNVQRSVQMGRIKCNSPRVPGQHFLHYAPMTKTMLITQTGLQKFLKKQAGAEHPSIACLSYSSIARYFEGALTWIKMPADPKRYARELYATLRRLDSQHFKLILIEDVPKHSVWDAIFDRIYKASASTHSDEVPHDFNEIGKTRNTENN